MASSYSCTEAVVGILGDLGCQAGNFLCIQRHSPVPVSYVVSSYSCKELWLAPWEVQGGNFVEQVPLHALEFMSYM